MYIRADFKRLDTVLHWKETLLLLLLLLLFLNPHRPFLQMSGQYLFVADVTQTDLYLGFRLQGRDVFHTFTQFYGTRHTCTNMYSTTCRS